MVIRTAHNELYNKITGLVDRTLSPLDAEFVKYVMYQDMEFGGSRNKEDMRVKSLLRRYENLMREVGEENYLAINEAIEKAVRVSGSSSVLKEVAAKKKLLVPLYVATYICAVENFKPAICKRVFADVEAAVESIKQPSLLDKLYNREL